MKKQLLTFAFSIATTLMYAQTFNKYFNQAGVIFPQNDGSYFAAYDSVYAGVILPGKAVAKFSPTGTIQWVHTLRNKDILSKLEINSIYADGSGGAVVVGGIRGTIYSGSDSMVSFASNYNDIFVARFNNAGRMWWKKANGTTPVDNRNDIAFKVAVKNNGVYVCGTSESARPAFGSITFANPYLAGQKMFLAKYDLDGNEQWVRMTSGSQTHGNYLYVDNSGNAFVSGYMVGSSDVIFSPTKSIRPFNYEQYIVKFNANGDYQQLITWGTGGGGGVRDITLDASGNIYAIGYSGNWGSSHNNIILREKISYLLKFSANGTFEWMRSMKAEHNASTLSGAMGLTESNGKIFVVGNFALTGYLQSNATDSVMITVAPAPFMTMVETFVAAYNASGTLVWNEEGTRSSGLTSNNQSTGILVSPDKATAYIAGTFTTTAQFGTLTLPAVGTLGAYMTGYITLTVGNSSTGVKQNEVYPTFSAYPNPANSQITIQLDDNSSAQVKILDLNGKELLRKEFSNTSLINIETISIPSGMCVLQIQTPKSIMSKKVLIAH